MKKYNFLLKPLFFIFSLLFATWLVVTIEKISPSDFGKYESYVSEKPRQTKQQTHTTNIPDLEAQKQFLKKICSAYKNGIIDSTLMDQQLSYFLKLRGNIAFK